MGEADNERLRQMASDAGVPWPANKRKLVITWSCLIEAHEHATEKEAKACIKRLEDFFKHLGERKV